jgi:aminopeptidase N
MTIKYWDDYWFMEAINEYSSYLAIDSIHPEYKIVSLVFFIKRSTFNSIHLLNSLIN